MIEDTNKRHLGRLVEETLIALDILLCQPTLKQVRAWHAGLRPMTDRWVDKNSHWNATLTNNAVHVKFHADSGHVELHVVKRANKEIKDRLKKEAAAIETLMAALRLYSTRRDELS
jgi:hypothetical protein